nr:glutamine-hydrolyzing GMP synthase [Synergistaceae bacterium]
MIRLTNVEEWVNNSINNIRGQVGSDKIVCGLSGGVDSSVSAMLVHKAVGSQLECIFVDHGLMRLNEPELVMNSYKDMGLSVRHVDASELFLSELKGVTDPEQKRRIIGKLFIDVFQAEANKTGGAKWLLQGTIYPDIIESGKGSGLVKSHHNVGGLPEHMDLKLLEPLRDLYKDEVREVGKFINMPESFIKRQPFPGPGLGVRCLGEINKTRLDTIRQADAIFREELKAAGIYEDIWQSFCVLLPVKAVGVHDGNRTYGEAVVLRAIHSTDAMTAEWVKIPYEVLDKTAKRICSEVKEINRVVMDVTSKPPATIEWE